MLIINNNKKDYYDGVVGTMGIDKTLIYDRKLIEIEEEKFPKFFKFERFHFMNKDKPIQSLLNLKIKKELLKKYPNIGFFVIGFCGKLYIGWKLYGEIINHNTSIKDFTFKITYDYDFIKTIVEPKGWNSNFEEDVQKVLNYNSLQLFRDLKTPTFIYDGDHNRTNLKDRNKLKFIINPLLKDYEFYKVFDSFQAFQEISMFIGGVLGRDEKEIVEVADKYKITQHGFDYKWSFRKESTKNK